MMCNEDGFYAQPEINGPIPKTMENVSGMQNLEDGESKGNYMVDCHGNILLDAYQENGCLPLGYNHPALTAAIQSPGISASIVSFGAPMIPPWEYVNLLQGTLLAVKPHGMSTVRTVQPDHDPVLDALKVAEAHYKDKAKSFSVISFDSASPDVQVSGDKKKIKIPFADLKYPYEENILHNKMEESSCLERAYRMIQTNSSEGIGSGFLVDPSRSAEGKESSEFYACLQAICKEFDVAFMVDEVDSGVGVTGQFWSHENWQLPHAPDMVAFGKKMMTQGYYVHNEFFIPDSVANISGPSDEPSRLYLLDSVLQAVVDDGLFQRVKDSGQQLLVSLQKINAEHSRFISNVSCQGINADITFVDSKTRDEVEMLLLNAGVHLGRCSTTSSLLLRPALIFTKAHAEFISNVIDDALTKLKNSSA